jgi:hypothetical protein
LRNTGVRQATVTLTQEETNDDGQQRDWCQIRKPLALTDIVRQGNVLAEHDTRKSHAAGEERENDHRASDNGNYAAVVDKHVYRPRDLGDLG